ncbi:NmrA family protein [Apiospora saccharicola]|uniref:NmrA family protein n=1 Tax=Apiospora saccharicola TaxID=335842 RepID=A0ABR1U3Q3_9PEZI
MAPSRVVLVTAASGNIGQHLIPLLASDPNLKLVLPTNRASSLQAQLTQHKLCQPGSNVFIEEGSIKEPRWFQGLLASHKVDTVILNLTGDDELFTTLNCLDFMARSGPAVKQLIYVSGCMPSDTSESIQRHIITPCSSAHVLVKPLIEQKIEHGGFHFAWTVLHPTLFFTNDLRSKPGMLEKGVFDVPFGEAGLSRVAPWDIALAAKNLVTAYNNEDNSKKWSQKKVAVGSRKMFKGSETARLWSEALGREITVLPGTEEGFDKFEDGFGALAGPAWGRDMRLMHEWFAVHGFGMTEEQYRQQLELLGREPEDYAAWVKATGSQWV